ncbi:conserved hypothetical protein [Sphingomonas sp. AX6]|nr:conserved hypothetical protein [Sphingomonas sp. AX6]
MAEMAKPWKHPQTGVYYLRRQIPTAIREAFDHRSLHKASLGTKDLRQATVLFLQANADLENKFEEARDRLRRTGSAGRSSRDRADEIVSSYFLGPPLSEGGVAGPDRLMLARTEIDRGLWNQTEHGCATPGPASADDWWLLSNNAATYRAYPGVSRLVAGHPIGAIWQFDDTKFRDENARITQVERVVEQIARYQGCEVSDLPDQIVSATKEFLNKLPVGTVQNRKQRETPRRDRPDLRLLELFEEWQTKRKPSLQTASEYRQSVNAFIDFIGDIPVNEINNDDVLNFRDAVASLPSRMSKAERKLPFTERLAAAKDSKFVEVPRVKPTTVKKQVGAIQALLNLAFQQRWVKQNVGQGIAICDYAKFSQGDRLTFNDEQLKSLFALELFLRPVTWKWHLKTTHCTLYWIFLISLTTGARLEEIGQALLRDVKDTHRFPYIDIDDYVSDEDGDATKSIKTAGSRRVIPIHDKLIALGFADYCEALRSSGQTKVFPDLSTNSLSKHTHDVSRRANQLIDHAVSRDSRVVFHSFRHTFKDYAREAELEDWVIDQICGHAPTTVGGKYGRGVRVPKLHELLHRIDWSFLAWETLNIAAESIDWKMVSSQHNKREK